MGLDQYAYSATRAGQQEDYYAQYDKPDNERTGTVMQPKELAYWRKHPNLQGWMRELWIHKGGSGNFNGDELELNWEDLDRLEHAVKNGELPNTEGFFFGDNSDDDYRDRDLEFIRQARADMFLGLRVFYNSSW